MRHAGGEQGVRYRSLHRVEDMRLGRVHIAREIAQESLFA